MQAQSDVMVNMRRLKLYEGILSFILIFNFVLGKRCDISDLSNTSPCSNTQVCDDISGLCQCRPGFLLFNDTHCIDQRSQGTHSLTPNTSSLVDAHGNGSIFAAILIPLFLILFLIYGVYLSRKYKLFSWVRRKMSQRSSNYDEFMIGQDLDDDDPPLR